MKPRQCTHEDRYADGHCRPCTRKLLRAWREKRAADAREQSFRAKLKAQFDIDLADAPTPPPCDLI